MIQITRNPWIPFTSVPIRAPRDRWASAEPSSAFLASAPWRRAPGLHGMQRAAQRAELLTPVNRPRQASHQIEERLVRGPEARVFVNQVDLQEPVRFPSGRGRTEQRQVVVRLRPHLRLRRGPGQAPGCAKTSSRSSTRAAASCVPTRRSPGDGCTRKSNGSPPSPAGPWAGGTRAIWWGNSRTRRSTAPHPGPRHPGQRHSDAMRCDAPPGRAAATGSLRSTSSTSSTASAASTDNSSTWRDRLGDARPPSAPPRSLAQASPPCAPAPLPAVPAPQRRVRPGSCGRRSDAPGA